MPIPGSKLNGAHIQSSNLFMVESDDEGDVCFPSFATFLGINLTTALDGQEVHTFSPVDGVNQYGPHTNIPCRKSPNVLVRAQEQEHSAAGFQTEATRYQIGLDRYIDDIDLRWQVQVVTNKNGVTDIATYLVQSVEHSGGNLRTRIMASELVPFNA